MQKRMGAQAQLGRWLAGFALVGLTLTAAPASASFHLIKVREIYPAASAGFVELQMYSAGEYLVAGHHLVSYNSNGSVADDFTLPSNVSIGSPNNATVLIAGPSYASAFPSGPNPDELDSNLNLSASGGAVCWTDGSPPDCVAWGNFTGPLPTHVPPFVVGSPASPSGVTTGKALRRTIAPGCSTLLEGADDSDDSATDFSEVEPNPRNNATAPTEKECKAPTVTIDEKPPATTNQTSASFKYHASSAGATFECKLDTGAFAGCASSGVEYTGLLEGKHTFQVRATDANGTGLPASYTWTVDLTAPEATILTAPEDPSAGNSAAFTYSSNESGSAFQCSLEPTGDPAVFATCPSTGKTYPDAEHPAPLADGSWTFEVRATDKAGNQSTPEPFPMGTYTWTVDNSLADGTPPETTILSRPPDPSESSTASFTYESNEAGSSFECALDGAPFTGCPASGIVYSGLGNGPHSFQVRAIDSSNNVDPTPAGYSFQVVLAAAPLSPPPALQPAPVPPKTNVSGKPAARTRDRTPTFRFRSPSSGATFQCKLDGGPYRACHSPFTTKVLSFGRHTLKIRAVLAGVPDPSPAKIAFRIVRP
jgi:hypothetical protein